jgi:hypothetical protein
MIALFPLMILNENFIVRDKKKTYLMRESRKMLELLGKSWGKLIIVCLPKAFPGLQYKNQQVGMKVTKLMQGQIVTLATPKNELLTEKSLIINEIVSFVPYIDGCLVPAMFLTMGMP